MLAMVIGLLKEKHLTTKYPEVLQILFYRKTSVINALISKNLEKTQLS